MSSMWAARPRKEQVGNVSLSVCAAQFASWDRAGPGRAGLGWAGLGWVGLVGVCDSSWVVSGRRMYSINSRTPVRGSMSSLW